MKKEQDARQLINQQEKIRKAVSTLAVVPKSGGPITRLARQAYSIMLMIAKEQTIETGNRIIFKAPLNSIIRGYEGARGSKIEVRAHVKSMISTVVEWQSPTAGESNDWEACGLLSWAKLTEEGGQTMFAWSYAPPILDQLMNPQIYAQLERSTIGKFRSHHGLALYEICARYKDNPSHKTSKNIWQWWQPVLTGKPKKEDSKTEYRFFKRDTLTPAIEEVNLVSELTVSMIEFKNGKSINSIQFEVRKKPEMVKDLLDSKPVEASALVKAGELGIQESVAEQLWEKHGNAKLLAALNALASRVTQSTAPVKSRAAYLRAILAEQEGTLAAAEAEVKKNPASKAAKEPTVNLAELSLQKTKASEVKRFDVIKNEIQALTDDVRMGLIADFAEYGRATSMTPRMLEKLEDGRWAAPMVLGALVVYYWKKTRGTAWSDEV